MSRENGRRVLCLVFGLVVACGSRASAQPATIERFGVIGIGEGQTLRLNVVAFPPNPCTGTIGFLSNDGGLGPVANKTVQLQPGQADFVDLPFLELQIPAVQRGEVQPVVAVGTGSACRASVEIFTTKNGATHVSLPQPQPDTPATFGMVGIALGEVLRLNVVAYPPNPCVAQIGFQDANGQPVPEPDETVSLGPGQSALVDLPAARLGLQPGQRAELQPVVTLMPGPNDGVSACGATAEVYARKNGRTQAVLEPQP